MQATLGVDGAFDTADFLDERLHALAESPTFGAMDVSWTSPLRTVV
jgi:hypothetical protein